MKTSTVSILIIEDQYIMRAGLQQILRSAIPSYEIHAADCECAVAALLCECTIELILIDPAGKFEVSGIQMISTILEKYPSIKIIANSWNTDRSVILETMAAGAKAYVSKSIAVPELLEAIDKVLHGHFFYSDDVSLIMMKTAGIAIQTNILFTKKISSRERDVLLLTAEGLTSRQIGKQLFISARTVESHRLHLMEKLDIHTASGLVKFVLENKLR